MTDRKIAKRLRHLPSGLAASAVVLVVGSVVGGIVQGGVGAAGAAAGVALVAASYVISSLVIAWADSVSPNLVMPVGLTAYVLKFTLIGLLMAAIAASGWPGLTAMGVLILAAALAWPIAQAWWTWRARIPYVEIDNS